MNQRFHALRVADVIVETEDARSLVFDVPDDLAGEFHYRPGQFLTVRIPDAEHGSVPRCYSLSSSPHTADPLMVTVKRTPAGRGSDWLLSGVRVGSVVHVQPPEGRFTPASLDGDFLFLAAGSGITPVMSIIKSVLAAGSGRLTLIYANRDERSVIFGKQLAGLAAAHPDRFTVRHWLESRHGLPDAAGLRAPAAPFRDRDAFVCGPEPFVAGAVDALAALGVPRERTHLEQFRLPNRTAFPEPSPGGDPSALTSRSVKSLQMMLP
ncbi:FAD-binding oxidoreductase [Streptomyces sp. NPDC090052]|uniref:FAD-binding oxidoreductase n=1 Tax=unclassified Streptomyces TaxID=2593676 RepID=UPI002256552E|nr:FAD-binding oxidoreductase [Streptomyces sp. NBC_01306]MCX4724061.1 FAD-binding oxidoreductase [Streptomyces sp. NBC_01306]WSV06394.1 FAD-binding oxidoreductase [Streptomyces sp. NBC_01020]